MAADAPMTLGEQNALLSAATAAAGGRCQCRRGSCLARHGTERCDSRHFVEHLAADPDLTVRQALQSGAALLVLCRYCALERLKVLNRRRARQSPGQRSLFDYTALDLSAAGPDTTPPPHEGGHHDQP